MKIKKKYGICFCIIGLSGSGKSGIGKLIKKDIEKRYGKTILIHGDEIRDIYNLKGYDKDYRLKLGKSNSNLCKLITSQGINIIFTTVGLIHKLQKYNRSNLENYLEIFIKSNIKTFLDNPNLKNATEMSIASNLAGKAISISKTTAPHAASYPFTSLFNISHGHAVGLFFESFFKFNFDNLNRSETSFDLKKRFDLIFNLFDVQNINDFNSKITLIKKQAKLEDNLGTLNIDIKQSSEKIIKGINLLRLGNNPVKIDGNDIFKIISKK